MKYLFNPESAWWEAVLLILICYSFMEPLSVKDHNINLLNMISSVGKFNIIREYKRNDTFIMLPLRVALLMWEEKTFRNPWKTGHDV